MSICRQFIRLVALRHQVPATNSIYIILQRHRCTTAPNSTGHKPPGASSPPNSPSYSAYEQIIGQGGGRPLTKEHNGQTEQTAFSATPNDEETIESDDEETEDETRFKSDLLSLALNHVPQMGWSTDAIALAAEQAGLSPSIKSMFQPVDLVHFFISRSNTELEEHLKGSSTPLTLHQALQYRLAKLEPFASSYADAIALISRPEHVAKSVPLLLELADSIAHYALKDSSADLNWYSKRLSIAGIYVASELVLVQDKSQGLSETWAFLERRCKEFEQFGKGEIFPSGSAGDLLHAGFTTFCNIIGRNSPR